MPFEKKIEPENKPVKPENTVRMQYRGHFKGSEKIVNLPIPLIANSQKLDKELIFRRDSTSRGPAFCDVPMEWAGTLLAVGGHWSLAEPITVELTNRMAAAKLETDAKMKKFIEENEMVDA